MAAGVCGAALDPTPVMAAGVAGALRPRLPDAERPEIAAGVAGEATAAAAGGGAPRREMAVGVCGAERPVLPADVDRPTTAPVGDGGIEASWTPPPKGTAGVCGTKLPPGRAGVMGTMLSSSGSPLAGMVLAVGGGCTKVRAAGACRIPLRGTNDPPPAASKAGVRGAATPTGGRAGVWGAALP
mmetsp:Transcript_58691/g.184237  ORF Transcript_58691/g.184237 Transcript_58691/m.184237 type:complete len:184 (+) Transcript_58691:2-553(+)